MNTQVCTLTTRHCKPCEGGVALYQYQSGKWQLRP